MVLGIVALGGGGYLAWQQLQAPYQAYEGERLLHVKPGTSASTILRQLADEGVIADARLARAYLVYYLDDPPLQAGEYRFDEALSTPQVLDLLLRGQVVTYPMTLIEGLTLDEAATAIADAGFGDVEVLKREMGRGDLVFDIDPQAQDLEGYLYPDTYRFASGIEEDEIVAALVRNFRQRFRRQVEPFLGTYDGTVRELVSLASIIEKEALLDDERPIISSVYNNRLRIGMALYADPTVIFAVKQQGTWDGNLRRPDLQLDSPYNTYVYPGLPPGPICSPGVASMVAAANPAETSFLYFVSRNDGSHVFAKTLSEHNQNVYTWQKQYWRRKWAEEKKKQ
jgi:UPF0755 protein